MGTPDGLADGRSRRYGREGPATDLVIPAGQTSTRIGWQGRRAGSGGAAPGREGRGRPCAADLRANAQVFKAGFLRQLQQHVIVRTAALLSVLDRVRRTRTRACESPGPAIRLVITRGTPPRVEGCRPASRGWYWNS